MTAGKRSLQELLDSAESDEDYAAIEALVAEQEAREASQSRWVATSLQEVAEVFGLALQTVKQWRIESPPMPGEPGAYPIPAIIKWRLSKLQTSDVGEARKQQERELNEVKIERMRLDLEREKGNLLHRQDVELWASTALVELREGVLQLPEMLAAAAPQDLKNFVRAETNRHCRDLLHATASRLELSEIKGARSAETAGQ